MLIILFFSVRIFKKESLSKEKEMYEENNDEFKKADEGDYLYNIVTTNGKPKTTAWSVAAIISAVLSLFFSTTGWAGLAFGLVAVFFAVYSRVYLGYFNGLSIAGLIVGIFGIVFSSYVLILLYVYDASIVDFLSGVGGDIPASDSSNGI